MSIMRQTSRCCMVCLMPQSQVSGSVENPHFNMLTLDRPTWVRNRLSAFQVVQGFSAPAGRCSSALMSRCTLSPFCDEPPVVIFDHCTSLHFPSILSSIPCHLEYHLFATIFVKLSVQFFLHTSPCYFHRPPGCFILLAI